MMKLSWTGYIYGLLILSNFCPGDAKLVYPSVKRDASAIDDHFGKKVPNPYKWLSRASQKEKERFMEEQTNFTLAYLSKVSLADRENIEKYMRIWEHEAFLHFVPTVKAGDNYIFFETNENKVFLQKSPKDIHIPILSNLLVSKEHDGEILVAAVSSPSGDTIAYSYSSSFEPMLLSTYQFRNTATVKDLSDVLHNVSTLIHSGEHMSWSIDGTGIFYMSNTSTPSAPPAKPTNDQKMYIFYHTIGTKQTEDIQIAELPSKTISALKLTQDGQYVVAVYDTTHQMVIQQTLHDAKMKKEMGCIYYVELCGKGKAPCKPAKDQKRKLTKIDITDSQFKFIGSKDSTFYVLLSNGGGSFDRIIQLDLSTPKEQQWKTVVISSSYEERISFAEIVKSESLVVVHLNQLTRISRMDVHKLSKVSEAKKVAIQYGRVTGISTCRKDSKVVFHMATILASHEAYAFDVSKGGPPEKIKLPGCAEDPFRDTIVTIEKKYSISASGEQMPILIMHGKNFKKVGKTPALMLLEGSSLTQSPIHKLLVPFMETFNGAVALAGITLAPYKSSPSPPNEISIQSTEAAINFLVKEKYTDKTHLTLAPGNTGFSSVLAAFINQRPNLCGAALLVDATAPASGDLASDSAQWLLKRSSRKFDLSAYFKDKESTEEYFGISPIHNIKVPEDKKSQYPAVLLADMGTDDGKRYISELQHLIGPNSQQVKPLLAKFPVSKTSTRTRTMEEVEIEQYADIFSFLVLSMDYKVTK